MPHSLMISSAGTSAASSSRIGQNGCVTRDGHNSAFHIGVSFGVYCWVLYSPLLSHSSTHGRRMGCTWLTASALTWLDIFGSGWLDQCAGDETISWGREDGGVSVHFNDERTNQKRGYFEDCNFDRKGSYIFYTMAGWSRCKSTFSLERRGYEVVLHKH